MTFPAQEGTTAPQRGVKHPQVVGENDDLGQQTHPGHAGECRKQHGGGKQRRPRSMGRYPVLTGAAKFLEENKAYYAATTLANFSRLFRRLNEILTELREAGKIAHISLKNMTEADIAALIEFMKIHDFEPSTMDKYLDYLNRLLLSSKNPVLTQLRLTKKYLLPREIPKEITTIPQTTLVGLKDATTRLEDPWERMVALFAVIVYGVTGLRPSELRSAKLQDLDTNNWTLFVSNPKGKGKYTEGRTVMIIPRIRGEVVNYLAERDAYLRENGQPDAEPLIPYYSKYKGHTARYYSQAEWGKLKKNIQIAAGVRFRWKDFRSTFAQTCIDNGARIESVSRLLGHSSTKITERYYGRIRNNKAMEEVARALEKPPVSIPAD